MALFGRDYEYDYGYRRAPRRYGRDYYGRDYDRQDYDLGDGFYRTIGRWGDPYARRRRPTYDRGYRNWGTPRRMRFVPTDSYNRTRGYGGNQGAGYRGVRYGGGYDRGWRGQGYDRGGWFW